MKRQLSTLLAALSLALCVAACALWVRSFHVPVEEDFYPSPEGFDYTSGATSVRVEWLESEKGPSLFIRREWRGSSRLEHYRFTKRGTYNLLVTISDGSFTATSSVTATVNQTVATLAVAIGASTVTSGTTRQFTASGEISSPAPPRLLP